jgi:hypothetical protein
LGNRATLRGLNLADNSLSGSIPVELGRLSRLEWLNLSGNELTNVIPPELADLTNLVSVDLSFNQLTGSLPHELSSLANLRTLFLGNNQLTGPIPSELGNLPNLTHLMLFYNKFTGPVPPQLGELSNLKLFTIENNQLTGPLPSTLTALSLEIFSYYNTALCEPGDATFQNWLAGINHLHGTGVACGTQTVTGLVWNDANRNGAQDAGEAGLAGATITLTQTKTAASVDAQGRRVFTDADGRYRFDYVATGAHAITVMKSGFLPSSSASIPINVPEGGITVPPVGVAWAPTHLYLPVLRK